MTGQVLEENVDDSLAYSTDIGIDCSHRDVNSVHICGGASRISFEPVAAEPSASGPARDACARLDGTQPLVPKAATR